MIAIHIDKGSDSPPKDDQWDERELAMIGRGAEFELRRRLSLGSKFPLVPAKAACSRS